MTDKPALLTRRKAIKSAVTLLGGTITAAQLGPLASSVAAMDNEYAPRFFSDREFSMLTNIVDLIMPATDTPGALDAGVHQFIDLMLAEWALPERRSRYIHGLSEIDERARALGSDDFLSGSPQQQFALLQELDAEATANSANDDFFRELKKMVLFAYYSSEIGATVELRFQRIPGVYRPCVPTTEIDRAWFWTGFSYDL